MTKYPTGPPICGSGDPRDLACKVKITSVSDVEPIIIFVYWGIVVICCSLFAICKFIKLKRHPVLSQRYKVGSSHSERPVDLNKLNNCRTPSDDGKHEELRFEIEGDKVVRFTGYKHTFAGEFCYSLACLTSVHWLLLFLVILLDTYNKCEVSSIDNLCFYGNYFIFGTYERNGTAFFTVWWMSGIWFVLWMLNRDQVHIWFRMPCQLSEAGVVHAWARYQEEILSTNVSFLVSQLRKFKEMLLPADRRGYTEIIRISTTKSGLRYFLFQGQRFLIDGDALHEAHLEVGSTYEEYFKCRTGLTQQEAERRLENIGLNEIPFKAEPFTFTVYDELFTLFHTYQLIMYTMWLWFAYLFEALLLVSIVILSAVITIYTRRKSQLAIAKLTAYKTEAEVLRDEKWKLTDSRELVPGDVVNVKSDWLLPCDMLLIKGSCVCNESALTGEAMPIQKYSAMEGPDTYVPEAQGARHTLFSGTTVLQAGTGSFKDVTAVVSSTGMSTSKGSILSAILFPEQMVFKYDEELPVVFLCLLCYACVCFCISIVFQGRTGQQSTWITKWTYCIAILSQIVSPLLPVALEVGQVHAVKRLKAQDIHCLNPKRIAIAGKIRVFCFDKTGTLTKNGLDFIGVRSVLQTDSGHPSFENFTSIQDNVNGMELLTLRGLATCHAVTRFGTQFVGNEVEVKMFSAVGWELIEDMGIHPVVCKGDDELTIVKRNEFDHTRATMSVIVRDKQGGFHVYCKGSFEKIGELSNPESLPENYLDISHQHALDGCYTLGLSYRNMGKPENEEDVLSLSRDALESNLSLVALLLFRNELKSDTQKAIEALKDGEVRTLMVTGDNAQTGFYIARKCAMVQPHVTMILAELDIDGRVKWSAMGSHEKGVTKFHSTEELLREHSKGLESGGVELAVTGKAFNVLYNSDIASKILFFIRIYARFTPEDKVKVINMHRDQGLVVGMCGDGGNDCGALRAAHAGIALSEAEASIVSPFTSKTKSVSSVVELLREGRGALHTSFACYKFLVMYGLLFSIMKLSFYWYGVIACQMDYIMIDGVAVLSLGYAMTLSHPAKKLSKDRPTSSLLGPLNVASILGVWLIDIVFMVGALYYMTNAKGYVKWPAQFSKGNSWWVLGDNWESTVIFFTMYYQFITSALVFTFGATFRREVYKNRFLVGAWGSILIFMSCILLLPDNGLTGIFHSASEQFNRPSPPNPVWAAYQKAGGSVSPAMTFGQRLSVWFIIWANMLCILAWQKIAVEGPIARLVAHKFPSDVHRFNF